MRHTVPEAHGVREALRETRTAEIGDDKDVPQPPLKEVNSVRAKLPAALIVSAAIAVIAAGPVAAAKPSSAYQPPVVDWVQPTVVAHADGTATVHVHYTCWGGSVGTHAFIGVKQGPDVNATDHTSSQFAETFYSTNWNADGPGNALTCDGKQQNQQFTVKPDPFFALGNPTAPALSRGTAFIQVCVFDSTNQGGERSERLRLRLFDAEDRHELTRRSRRHSGPDTSGPRGAVSNSGALTQIDGRRTVAMLIPGHVVIGHAQII